MGSGRPARWGCAGKAEGGLGAQHYRHLALNRPGVEALIADARRASPDLGSLGGCDGCGGGERNEGAKRVQRMLHVLACDSREREGAKKGSVLRG